jgi:Oligosaccharyltransferase 48 kDa subunit beta
MAGYSFAAYRMYLTGVDQNLGQVAAIVSVAVPFEVDLAAGLTDVIECSQPCLTKFELDECRSAVGVVDEIAENKPQWLTLSHSRGRSVNHQLSTSPSFILCYSLSKCGLFCLLFSCPSWDWRLQFLRLATGCWWFSRIRQKRICTPSSGQIYKVCFWPYELSDSLGRGYSITFASPRDSTLSLFYLGERSHDHILVLPPSGKAYGDALSPKKILDFVNADGNVLLALSGEKGTPAAISSLLLEMDVALPADRQSVVVDHFGYDSSASEQHDVLVVDAPTAIRSDVKNYFGGDLPLAVPHAVGQALGNENPLLVPILRAPSTAYTHNPKDTEDDDTDGFVTGSQIALVSAMQARNSARFTVLGSEEMLWDQWFDATVTHGTEKSKTGNRAFAKQLTEWTFGEVGVVKVGELHHNGSDQELDPTIYRIKSDVVSCSDFGSALLTCRPLPLSSPSMPAHIWFLLFLLLMMRFNLNSVCFRHFIV